MIPRYHIYGANEFGLDFDALPDGEWVKWSDLAALFTPEDMTWLRRMEFGTFDRTEAEAHHAWFKAFLARLDTVLPREPTT